MKSFSLTDLQQQVLVTSMAFRATGINCFLTGHLMELTSGLLEEGRDFEEVLSPIRIGLSEIHELLRHKKLPPWIKRKVVRQEVRKLAKMLRPRSFKNMQVQFDCVLQLDIPLKDIPVVRREIERAFNRIDTKLFERNSVQVPEKRRSANASRKRASKNDQKKRTRPMVKLA